MPAPSSSFARSVVLLVGIATAVLLPELAWALPSFASQTGQACASCHTVAFGPALTPVGQQFKLDGYTQGSNDGKFPPLALMQVSSFTHTQARQPGGAAPHFGDNGNVAADQTSVFYAGRISDKVGAFVQVTYDGIARQASWDNLDIRYADHGSWAAHDLTWGISLNNNPTVQDLWNSTPAWSFPYVGSGLAPTPAAAPLLESSLAQQVGGLTAYAMIDRLLYLEAGAYRTLPLRSRKDLGIRDDGITTISGMAPYWRAALQRQYSSHYASAGVFGMSARLNPGGDASAGADHVTDLGYDATYQFNNGGPNSFNANVTYIHELQNLPASFALGGVGQQSNAVNTARANAGWVYKQTYSVSGGAFAIRGGEDTALYAPNPIGGSANGSPNSRGYLAQFEFVPFGKADSYLRPWLNLRLGLQYTYYSQFNGGSANYDGSGRSAHDNNTLFGFLWWAF